MILLRTDNLHCKGSPVGRWAGYFLMQHKKQLGGNKFISKVRVFKPDQGSLPYMLFYADGKAPDSASTPRAHAQEDNDVDVHIVKRSDAWKGIVREHVFRVGV
jgi:hypothetical protein